MDVPKPKGASMCKDPEHRQSALPPALQGSLSPLFYLLGKLEGQLDEDDRKQLVEDFLQYGRHNPVPPSCAAPIPDALDLSPLLRRHPPSQQRHISIMQVTGKEPVFFFFHSATPTTDPKDSMVELGLARIWEPILYFQDAFTTLEAHYPLRAAALYLRSLTRIWVELVEGRRLDILAEKEFLRLYLEAMLQVEALAARCERCSRTNSVKQP